MMTRSDRRKKLGALDKRIKQKYDRLRNMYPEIRGKKVDFVQHWIEQDTIFFSVRFTDGTSFCVRYEPTAKLVGVDYLDMRGPEIAVLKEYFRRRD